MVHWYLFGYRLLLFLLDDVDTWLKFDWHVFDVVITIITFTAFYDWMQRYNYVTNFTFVRYWTKTPSYFICNNRTKCKCYWFSSLFVAFLRSGGGSCRKLFDFEKETIRKFKVISPLWQSKPLLPQLHCTSINQRCFSRNTMDSWGFTGKAGGQEQRS